MRNLFTAVVFFNAVFNVVHILQGSLSKQYKRLVTHNIAMNISVGWTGHFISTVPGTDSNINSHLPPL